MSLLFRAGMAAWAFILGGCGFPQPRDVAPPDAIDTPRCNPRASFGTPVPLTSLNAGGEAGIADLSTDELTIYFSSPRAGGLGLDDIYQATRTSTDLPFGNIMPVSGVNTAEEEREPRMTADRLSMFAISTIVGNPGFHLMLATRPNTSVAFGGLKPLANVNSFNHYDDDPFILADGDVLYFSSDRGGDFGPYRSTRSNGVFSAPAPVSGIDLDLPALEANPVVAPDELTLYFTSSRPGGAGLYEIYQATRSRLADGFGPPVALTTVNTPDMDLPVWISPDSCNLYITRIEMVAGRQLYVATRGQ